MAHKYLFWLLFESFRPLHQSLIICMTTDARQNFDLCIDLNLFPEQFDLFRSFHQRTPRCTDCLISHKQNRTFRSPQIVFQVMLNPTGIAHTTGRDNDLRAVVKVDGFGFFTGDGKFQSRERDRIDSFIDQLHRLFIKTVFVVFIKYSSCSYCQRTIHKHRETIVSLYHMICLDLTDKIKHLLCSSHCKRRDHHIPSPVEGSLDHSCQLIFIAGPWTMAAVTVGRLHHHIICRLQIRWILN